jgi:glutaredoxin
VRCATHGLAVGPDGTCVLCRGAEKRGTSRSNAPLVALVGVVLLVAGTALALRLLGTRPGAAESMVKEETRAPAANVEQPDPPEAVAMQAPAAPPFPVAPAPTPGVVIEAPLVPSSAAPSAVVSAEPPPRAPSSAEVTAALRSTPIVMFSTSWCGVCQRARAFFDTNGLRYTERDVDIDAAANAELRRLTGKGSVPAFLVDGKLVGPGFSEASLKHALVASVERRLGVKAEARGR